MNVVSLPVQEVDSRTDTQRVFDTWKRILGHERAKMDRVREKVIRDRLNDGYSIEDLELACYGCKFSAFHQGDNERGTRYDSITLILRDADHVERFMQTAEQMIERMKRRTERQEAKEITRGPAGDGYKAFLEQAAKLGIKVGK